MGSQQLKIWISENWRELAAGLELAVSSWQLAIELRLRVSAREKYFLNHGFFGPYPTSAPLSTAPEGRIHDLQE